ncbi:DUF6394 family protein [Helicobacter kayseriensis]|uniref:DUF6394 family protein n=1 Tax=Helicobacter kayseriensis TaxID=2905877 RepID=UPI001E304A7A|nr:DUF6394 family protein [Helicobacter kayseriensis]MCE3047089.1 DUF6394 family protein [Helicobacter kayseriensis]MCE3048251.1 DUF6394 family protein [Helicobacter kayseriensis]
MDWGRVFFIFFSLMSLTSVIGYVYNESLVMLFIAAAVNFISTTLKIGVKNMLSSEMLASSLVVDLHLIPAFLFYQLAGDLEMTNALAIGALAASVFSVALMLIECAKSKDSDY